MKQFGVGIIAAGDIADTAHAPAISAVDQASLVAILSRDHAKGEAFLQKHDAVDGSVHTSLSNFAADPKIDLVIVCSPDKLHYEQAAACLKAGKHVLLEKPMTLETNEALELVKLATENKLTLAIGFHLRFHNGFNDLLKRVEDGEIGTIRHIRAMWTYSQEDDSDWRAKSDLTKWWSLSAVGSHCINLVRWFAGDQDDWKSFSAVFANNLWQGPHDETAVIAGQLASGPTVEVVSSVQFGRHDYLEIFGSKGIARCVGSMGRDGAGNITINDIPMSFDVINPYAGQLKEMIECIETGKTPKSDGAVGARSVKDLLLALETSQSKVT